MIVVSCILEACKYLGEVVGRDLLGGIAPGCIGGAVRLYHQAVKAVVEGLAADIGDEVTAAADVRGVAEDGQLGHLSAQFKGNLPQRGITIERGAIAGEAAQDGLLAGGKVAQWHQARARGRG